LPTQTKIKQKRNSVSGHERNKQNAITSSSSLKTPVASWHQASKKRSLAISSSLNLTPVESKQAKK
jgi:hypothetical protein